MSYDQPVIDLGDDHTYKTKTVERLDGLESNKCVVFPYSEIFNTIKILIKPNGFIRSWKYSYNLEAFYFYIGGTRFCKNVERQHRSNHVYFIFSMKDGCLRQACFSCKGFYSQPISCPSLKWLDFEPWTGNIS